MSLKSKAFARFVDLVSEGEIEGLVDGAKSIYLNGTPLQNQDNTYNFENVTWDSRVGTQDQSYIEGIPSVESESAVNTEVTNATPVVRTISDSNVDAVRVTVYVPALYFQNSKGDLEGQSVNLAVDVQPSGGSYSQILTDTISGKATSKYQRSYRIPLSGSAPWNIRLRRITADSTNIRLVNKTYWESFTSIIDAKLRYPNSALVSLKFDASTFSGTPARGYDLKLKKIKIPTNYNPITRVYSGVWNGNFKTEWSDNPAWCFYDLVTNTRYGLGEYLPAGQIDKWGLYTIAQYCDELVPNGLGGTEPRFTCNLYLQSKAEAFKVINDIASCFRSMVYWAAGSMTLAQDAPSDPVGLFTQSNVVDGLFTYAGSSAKARHTVALVTWNDPADFYKQKVEYVEDAEGISRYGIVTTEVAAMGCTSRGQANRVGRWLLYAEKNETETVTFSTGIEAATVRPGDIIKVADSSRAGVRLGGRVRTATTSAITVDAAVNLGASAWTMYVMLPNGSVASSAVTSAAGNTINLTTTLAAAPQTGAQWIMTSTSTEAQTFRVLNVVEKEGGEIEVTALKHEPLKYSAVETGLVLPDRTITTLTATPDAPASVTLSESLYTYQAEVRAAINIGWPNVQGATTYLVQWSKDGGNFVDATTSISDYDILNITPGAYTIRVYSIGATGKQSSTYAEATITALGKTAPPANVTGLAAVTDPNIGITLTWDKVADLDLDGYEIKDGATVLGIAKTTSFKVGLLPTGTKTYTVRALDTSGNYSTTAASVNVTINAAAAPVLTGSFVGENLVLTWGAVQGTLATESYEIRYGASFAAGTTVATIKGTSFSTKAQWSGARTFWIAAVDLSGSVGTAGSFVATVTVPSAVTITQEVIDNNVLLKWSDATATLPVDYYELRKGATWATAAVIGRVSARFSVVFESSAGTYKYWLAGVDVAGNLGTQSNIDALVNQPPDYQLEYDLNSTFSGTKSNFVQFDGGWLTPVDTAETWQSHFTSRSWNTPQDQINAGYPIYAMPSTSAASYEEVIDYGTVLAATKITATLSYTSTAGSVTVTPRISVRKLVTDPWTDYNGVSAVFVTDFRYAKIRFDFASVGGDDLVTVTGLNVRFDVKLRNDAGTATANSADSGGTTVNFNVAFVDVESITVTPKGTAARIAVYDFVDVPNPTSFKILLFDTAGTRVSGDVSWSVKGI
jgi:predicted phage tail protein